MIGMRLRHDHVRQPEQEQEVLEALQRLGERCRADRNRALRLVGD